MFRPLAALCLALVASAAAAATAEEVAHETAAAYEKGKTAAVLKLERDCWASATRATVRLCTQRMLAGGILDMAMQQVERRGPMDAQVPQAQRQRFDAGVKRAGLSQAEIDALQAASRAEDVPAVVRGLREAGVPIY